jgi:hypothetical protein
MEKNNEEKHFPQADTEPSSLFKDARVLIGILSLTGIVAGAVVAGFFSLKESQGINQTTQMQILVEQTAKNYSELRLEFNNLKKLVEKKDLFISELTQSNLALQIELANKNIELVRLKAENSKQIKDEDLAQRLVDSLKFPAWVKEYNEESNEFIMIAINEIYTVVYGKTKTDYIGFTDYDIYPKEIADEYRRRDFEALNNFNSVVVKENTMKNGEDFLETSIKFKIQFSSDRTFIGGFIITGSYLNAKIINGTN